MPNLVMLGDRLGVHEVDIEVGGDFFTEASQFRAVFRVRRKVNGREMTTVQREIVDSGFLLVSGLFILARLQAFEFYVDVMEMSAIMQRSKSIHLVEERLTVEVQGMIAVFLEHHPRE